MLEIIALNQEEAKIIEKSGGDRIELVRDMASDGLTPSITTLEAVLSAVGIPVHVMVRHHNRGFTYNKHEFKGLMDTVKILKAFGVQGIVFGSLKDGTVDRKQLECLLSIFTGKVTFHRAIDAADDPILAYRILSQYPVEILTSGGPGKAIDHLQDLDEMYDISAEQLLIGSGVNLSNLEMLKSRYPKASFHIGSGARRLGILSEMLDGDRIHKMQQIVR